MNSTFLIFLGGGLGAALRYQLSIWIQLKSPERTFPYPVLTCNLIGCFIIGILFGYIRSHHPTWLHPLFITGLLGGFTTFSSFALDTQKLLQNTHYIQALIYTLTSLIGGITLCYLGYKTTAGSL